MRLKKATTVPKFRNEAEEAEFWSTHDTSAIWRKARAARPVRMPAEQVKAIQRKRAQCKTPISIRLDAGQIEAAKQIAARKSIGYQTQLRIWIGEGIRRER